LSVEEKESGSFSQHRRKLTDMNAADSRMDSVNEGQICCQKYYLNTLK